MDENLNDDQDQTDPLEDDYYAFLNISREASNEEITNAYRRLSRLYHPDKHVDPERKREAEVMFNKTKNAYEVLRDEHKRAIYDSVGLRGLETDGWEIIQRTKTPQEIREEYQRLARQREERRLQARTNPKGTVTVNINATDLFSTYDDYGYEMEDSLLPSIEISGMSINQSIESPLSSRDTATISGQLNTHNGTGNGGLTVTNRRNLSEKGWLEVFGSAGNGPLLGIKGFRTLTRRVFFTGETHLHFSTPGLRSNVDLSCGAQLDRQTMGYLSWRGGSSSGMSSSLARDTPSSHFSMTLYLGVPHSFVSTSYTWKLTERQIRLRTAIKVGTFGSVLEYGAEKKISEQSTVGAAVSLGVPSGVILKIKLVRGSQTYNFPIHLCEEIAPSPVFYATVTPLITWALIKKLIIDPIQTEKRESDRQRQKQNYSNRLAEKRKEAEAAVNLMKVTFSRVRNEEETRKGLVIVAARYGRLATLHKTPYNRDSGESAQDEDEELPEVMDVTIPCQCLVKDSKLLIHDSSKSGLPGFYDPCPGEEKGLYVQYLFHTHMHQTTITDKEPLRIPRQSHRVAGVTT